MVINYYHVRIVYRNLQKRFAVFGQTPSPRPGASIALHLRGTNFQIKVWEALLCLPPGAATRYEALAEQVGSVKAARAVGNAVARKTLGFMLPGDYEFSTGAREVMELLNGGMDVLLPGRLGWQTFKTGESFEVPANSSFQLKLKGPVDYCCSYG